MTDVDDPKSEGIIIDEWHHVKVSHGKTINSTQIWGRLSDAVSWLEQTPGGRYYWTIGGNIWFERLEDKIVFQLSWSD